MSEIDMRAVEDALPLSLTEEERSRLRAVLRAETEHMRRDHEAMEWLGEICWNMSVRERLTGGVEVAVLPVEGRCVRGDGETLADAILDAKRKSLLEGDDHAD